jgi:putative inorganic carbon (HCO3(-)) transporter
VTAVSFPSTASPQVTRRHDRLAPARREWATRPVSIGLAGWCVAAYVFLLPVQFDIGADLRIAPSDLFVGAYVVLRLPRMRLARAAWSGWQPTMCAAILTSTLVALLTEDLLTSYVVVQKGLGMASLVLTFACIVDFCIDDPHRLAWLCRSFLFGVLGNVILGLVVMHLQQAGVVTLSMINLEGVRLSGLLIDPNAFGGLLVVAIALHFTTRALGTPLVTGAAGLLLTVLLPIGLVLTYSRSAWIGMTGAGLVGTYLAGSRLVAAYGKVVLGLAVVAITAASIVLPNAAELINRQEQVEERVTIIEDGLTEFMRRPLTGIGLGVFDDHYDVIIHNTTWWFLVELGPFGLVAFAGFLLAFWWKGWHAARVSRGGSRPIVIGLLAAHVGMYGVSMGIEAFYQRHWWFVFAALGVSYAYVVRASEPTSPELTKELP